MRLLVGLSWLRCMNCLGKAAFNDLVQFPSIKPYAAALRAIVNLDPLPVTHGEGYPANRTWHGGKLFWVTHVSLLSTGHAS